MPRRPWFLCVLYLPVVVLAGCGTDPSLAPSDPRALLDALLKAPTSGETAAALTELRSRSYDPAPGDPRVLDTRSTASAELSLVAYRSGGLRVYGVISRPRASGNHPLILYNHGGDGGLSASELDMPVALGFIVAASSFRSEAVHWFGVDYRSDGPPSPWDRDVDDALVLFECASRLPGADPARAIVLGGSRGGGVSLLAAARRPDRFRCVIDIYGPTDFFDPTFRPTANLLASGGTDRRPGMAFLKESLLLPYLAGSIPQSEARAALIRRSALYFADRLPPVQIHHGVSDEVVPISQSDRLADQLNRLGRPCEYYRYPGFGHDWPLSPDALSRILSFVRKYL
jgi:dipeptidyl aminopeptidase/acylaminoacyl peptidase